MKGGEGVKTVALSSKDFSKRWLPSFHYKTCLNSSVILRSDNPQFPPSEKIVVNPDSVSSRIGPLSSATGNAESAGNCCQYCDDEIDHVLQCYILHSVQILSG